MVDNKSAAEIESKNNNYMQKLTLIEDIMPDELVRYYFPTADDEDVDWILWNHTCFPYGPIDRINDGIYDYYIKSKK